MSVRKYERCRLSLAQRETRGSPVAVDANGNARQQVERLSPSAHLDSLAKRSESRDAAGVVKSRLEDALHGHLA